MKPITTLLTIIFITLLSFPSWSETKDDLVERNDLYYKKFTDVPFTGKVTGQWNGKIKNGKQKGLWKTYFGNGQLWWKGIYIDGKKDGLWEGYWENGNLFRTGNYINGKPDGIWKYFGNDGHLAYTKNFRNGLEIN